MKCALACTRCAPLCDPSTAFPLCTHLLVMAISRAAAIKWSLCIEESEEQAVLVLVLVVHGGAGCAKVSASATAQHCTSLNNCELVQHCAKECNCRQKVSNWTAWLCCIHFHFKHTNSNTNNTNANTKTKTNTNTKSIYNRVATVRLHLLCIHFQIQVQHICVQREIQLDERHWHGYSRINPVSKGSLLQKADCIVQ